MHRLMNISKMDIVLKKSAVFDRVIGKHARDGTGAPDDVKCKGVLITVCAASCK